MSAFSVHRSWKTATSLSSFNVEFLKSLFSLVGRVCSRRLASLGSCACELLNSCFFSFTRGRLHGGIHHLLGGKKMEDPHSLKSNEMAECSFQPQQPLVADTFKNCEGLSRVAFMDGNGVVMLGKVISCEQTDVADKAGGKKK